jgi:hypothetical protein
MDFQLIIQEDISHLLPLPSNSNVSKYFLYKNVYKTFLYKGTKAERRKIEGNEPIWVMIHIYMEKSQ